MKQSLRNAVYKEILLLQPDAEVGIPYCQCTDNTNGESQETIDYIVHDRKEDIQQNTNFDKKRNVRKMENDGNSHKTDSEERETFNEESKFGEKQNEREIKEAGSSSESSCSFLKSGTEESGVLGKQSGPNCNMLEDGKILEVYNILQTVVSTSALNLGEEVGNAVETGIHLVSSTNEDEIVSCEGKNDSQSKIDNCEEDKSEKESANTENKSGSICATDGIATRNKRCHTPVSEIIPDQSEIRNIGFVSPKAYADSNQSVGLTEMEKLTETAEMGGIKENYTTVVMNSIQRFIDEISSGSEVGERPHVTDPLFHMLDPIISNVGKSIGAIIETSVMLSSSPTIHNWEDHPLVSID